MINSHYIHNKITGTNSAVKRMIGEELTDNQIIKEIYNKLEQMHDNRKKIESATNYL